MSDDRGEPELDLHPGRGEPWTSRVLVPLHADNWGLALASGYVGGSLRADPAVDLQGLAGDGLLGFVDRVPGWAIDEGEDGPRVILSIPWHEDGTPPRELVALPSPLRITGVSKASFKDQAGLDNFHASYDAFPDVPAHLVESDVDWPDVEDQLRPQELEIPTSKVALSRGDLDFTGGWAAALVSLLAEGGFDAALTSFLSAVPSDADARAREFLLALEPGSSELDVATWVATVSALERRRGKKGFDRSEFLAEIASTVDDLGDKARAWAKGCQRVVDAEIDVPSLDDSSNVGRRAALGVVLAHEPRGLPGLEDDLGAGPKVGALARVAVFAFTGLSRLDAEFKQPASRMDATLAIAEVLCQGGSLDVATRTTSVAADLSRQEEISIAGKAALTRSVEPPPYLLMLKARAQEAGYAVEINGESGQLEIRSRKGKAAPLVIEDSEHSSDDNPVVNLVVEIAKLGARPTVASFKDYMSTAWKHATTIALRESDGAETVVAMASLPLATLDRDEFTFNVERLLAVSAELGGTKTRKRRARQGK